MKFASKIVFALLLCLLLGLMVPAAFAEGGNVVVGFETLDDGGVVRVDHKYALVTLQKYLPQELHVQLSDGSSGSVGVVWKCLDNYDEALDAFRFVPVPGDLELAEGLDLPELTVIVEESFTPPPTGVLPVRRGHDVPIVGARRRGTPVVYNSFENGELPPVRDQGQWSTCWAFGILGAIEADLIHDKAAGTDVDLSELHLAYCTYHPYYDEKGCNEGDNIVVNGLDHLNYGGNERLAIFTGMNMVGIAEEADVPYQWAADYFPSPYAGRAWSSPLLAGTYFVNTADTAAIKDAIMEHGGVCASIHMDQTLYYSAEYNSYYSTPETTNHAIMLVGWDDHFPKENFRDNQKKPSADGAWLVRNSWGVNDYDVCGYFWMSYEDVGFLASGLLTVCDAQPQGYQHCYAYDAVCYPFGTFLYESSATESQVFTVDGGERIEAVAFYADPAGLKAEISLTWGNQTVTTTAYTAFEGYHLVPLETPLEIPVQSKVTLSITLSGQDKILIDTQGLGAYDWGPVHMEAACAGGGLVVNGENLGVDGYLKLYTNDYDASVAVNAENFPNPAFRAYVLAEIDLNRDKILSPDEIAAVKTIDISGGEHVWQTPSAAGNAAEEAAPTDDEATGQKLMAASALSSTLKGVEYFTLLESLSCDYNKLTGLDLSRNTMLKTLSCTHNLLKSLDLSTCPALAALLKPELLSVEDGVIFFRDEETETSLRADAGTKLTPAVSLGTGISITENFPDENFRAYVSDNYDIDGDGTLVELEISAVTKIDVSNSGDAPIASLVGVGLFKALRELNCNGNESLTSLDVSGCSALETLNCYQCKLERLTVGEKTALTNLTCILNCLTELDVSGCAALETLNCRSNQLESLKVSGCSALRILSCRDNRLAGLDLSDCAALQQLLCYDNHMTDLDLTGCPRLLTLAEETLPQELSMINFDDGEALLQFDKNVALCPGLPDLRLPEDLAAIGEEAFSGGTFTHVKLSKNTVTIGPNAFAACPILTYFYIPAENAVIDPLAFGGRTALTILGLPGSTAETFAEAYGITFITVA